MDVYRSSIEAIYLGWHNHQGMLINALGPLTAEQLELKPVPNLRSIEAIATHTIGARARWFAPPLGDGDTQLAAYGRWDRRGEPVQSAEEIVQGSKFKGDYILQRIARWSSDEWQETMPGEEHEPEVVTPPWIIWHLIEHDLHHTVEISIIL